MATSYSREFCEPEYDPHVTAPDGAQVMARRLQLAEKARSSLPAHLDLAYGPTAKERLDIFPATGTTSPVMVFIHGGYWQRLDKSALAFLAEPFRAADKTLVLVNYNLCPTVTLDNIVAEVRSACRWVWHNINRFGGDPDRIYVSGNSAGGHLSAMMAATDWTAFDETLPSNLIKGASLISGIYDLEPIRFTSINDAVGLDIDSARRNSPVYLRPTMKGPLLIPVGRLESSEFQRQSREIAVAWGALEPRLMVIDGCHHYNILLELTDSRSSLYEATMEMLR